MLSTGVRCNTGVQETDVWFTDVIHSDHEPYLSGSQIQSIMTMYCSRTLSAIFTLD